MNIKFHHQVVLCIATLGLSGCFSSMPTLGGGSGNTVTGAAAGSASEGANSSLESCDESLGTLRVFEDKTLPWWREYRRHYPKLGSTLPVIRMMIQQSNCFVVVERGQAMNAMNDERRLMSSGALRGGSNFGGGQMVAADYTLSPSVQFTQKNSSGMSGLFNKAVGSFGPVGGLLRGGGKVNTNESSTTLLLIDNRSGVQVSSSVGSAKNYDVSLFGMSIDRGGFASVSGFSNSPEGKVIMAAFADSYNQMVKALRQYKPQVVKGGLGKGGQLTVDGSPPATTAPPSSPPAIAAAPSVPVKHGVSVRENDSFNVEIDSYDERAFEKYYESLKKTIKVMPTLAMYQEGQVLPAAAPRGADLKSMIWMLWSTHAGKMDAAKIELEFWPQSAKEQVWQRFGTKLKRYNKLFNKHRKDILANEEIDPRVRNAVRGYELVTKESLFAE